MPTATAQRQFMQLPFEDVLDVLINTLTEQGYVDDNGNLTALGEEYLAALQEERQTPTETFEHDFDFSADDTPGMLTIPNVPPPLDPARLVTIRARVSTENASGVIDQEMTNASRALFERQLEAVQADLARHGIPMGYSFEGADDDADEGPADDPTDEQVSRAIDARHTRALGFEPPDYDAEADDVR